MAQLSLKYSTLDVFTDCLFSGNPLAIVHVPNEYSSLLTQTRKQLIAQEFNLSETVFLHEPPAANSEVKIDIFTTTAELPFAGHPTIGSACYFMTSAVAPNSNPDVVKRGKIITKAGEIPITYSPVTRYASAQIPHDVHIHQSRIALTDLLQCQPKLSMNQPLLPSAFPVVSIVKGMSFVLIELPDVETLARVSTTTIATPCHLDVGWDESFVANYFFVKENHTSYSFALRTRMIAGILEDPATGSAASALAAFLSIAAETPSTEFEYQMIQGVEIGRKSEIGVKVRTNTAGDGIEHVVLSGKAVVVSEGKLRC